jgi:Tol biopolymer transport system component
MGEVYRARDPRLGREVAVKVLPAEVSQDPERRRRFEQEARAASALNHPNIVTVYDVGSTDDVLFVAQELIEGKTLRELLADGPLPARRILDLAAQVAEGLAKAHEAGIVHRDLKPENLVVSKDAFVKVVDFGLAKVGDAKSGDIADLATLAKPDTTPGTVMGTVGYMSPEQAAGRRVDFRSDQFSLGSILYEMASGQRPFRGASSAETLAAIIREDPEPLGRLNPKLPAPLRWTIERCLAKEREDRYASTRDLARDLRSLRDHLSEASVSGEVAPPAPPWPRRVAALAAAGALVAGGFALGRYFARPEPPSYEPVTSQRGYIYAARYGPDGQSIVYSATWEGGALAIYLKHPTSPDALTLDLPSGSVLAVSSTGEIALALDCRRTDTGPGICVGTLARAPLAGGAPREMLENIQQADWTPDGSGLAAVRVGGEQVSLEYPLGHVLAETSGHISFPRLSPKGDVIAFIDHPIRGDDRGFIAVVDREGRKRRLTEEWVGAQGLAWSPSGEEVWFTAGVVGGKYQLRAVTLKGRQRLVVQVPGNIRLHDIARDGRVLLTRDSDRRGILALSPGESREREVAWRDWSILRDISEDGKTILFDEEGMAAGPNYLVCLRRIDGPLVRTLGEGFATRLSPDGKWALSRLPVPTSPLVLLPTGAGEPRRYTTGLELSGDTQFLPNGQGIVFGARERGRKRRYYLLDLAHGQTKPISPEGMGVNVAISPDGRFLAATGPAGPALFPVEGGAPRPFSGLLKDEEPMRWSGDGGSVYVRSPSAFYPRIFRIDVSTGRRTFVKELVPPDPAGLVAVGLRVRMTADGRSYAYGYTRTLSELFVATGLK